MILRVLTVCVGISLYFFCKRKMMLLLILSWGKWMMALCLLLLQVFLSLWLLIEPKLMFCKRMLRKSFTKFVYFYEKNLEIVWEITSLFGCCICSFVACWQWSLRGRWMWWKQWLDFDLFCVFLLLAKKPSFLHSIVALLYWLICDKIVIKYCWLCCLYWFLINQLC